MGPRFTDSHQQPAPCSDAALDDENDRLAGLGYSQVLYRGWHRFTSIATCISCTSVLIGVYIGFHAGLAYGGPAALLWGWCVAAVGSMCVTAGMAELASAYPTAGGMYFWMYQLSGPAHGLVLSWLVGWIGLLGQLASLSSIFFVMTKLIQVILLLSTGTGAASFPPPSPPSLPSPLTPPLPPTSPALPPLYPDYPSTWPSPPLPPTAHSPPLPAPWTLLPGPGLTFTPLQQYCIYCCCAVATTSICSLPHRYVSGITDVSAYWHAVGVALITLIIPLIATTHAPAAWVFTRFDTGFAKEMFNIPSDSYALVLGLLAPAYVLTGGDSPAHMAEEIKAASSSVPFGMVGGMAFTAIAGWIWIVSLLFCVDDMYYVLGDAAGGYPAALGDAVPQIFFSAFEQRFGDGSGGIMMLMVLMGGGYFCAHSTLTFASRILFSFSRDNALPLSRLWTRFNPWTRSPLNAIWATALLAMLLGLPMVIDLAAFQAVTSLCTIGLNTAYVLPIVARLTWGRDRFKPGPWNLGAWSYPVGIIAALYVSLIVVVFSLPTMYPVTSIHLNFAGIALLGVVILALAAFYLPVYGAHAWFKGPGVAAGERVELEKKLRVVTSRLNAGVAYAGTVGSERSMKAAGATERTGATAIARRPAGHNAHDESNCCEDANEPRGVDTRSSSSASPASSELCKEQTHDDQ